jgi:hypothetical protein
MIKLTRNGAYTHPHKLVNFETTYSQCCSASHLFYRSPYIADQRINRFTALRIIGSAYISASNQAQQAGLTALPIADDIIL